MLTLLPMSGPILLRQISNIPYKHINIKRFLIIFTFSFIGLNAIAQNKLFVSVDASPILSYRYYKLIESSTENSGIPSGQVLFDSFKHIYDSIESSKYGYQISLGLGYHITGKLGIQTGIQFKNIGVNNVTSFPLVTFVEIDGNIVAVYSKSKDIKGYLKFYYLGLPIGIQYKVISINRFYVGFQLGSTIDFLLFHKNTEAKMSPNSATKEDFSEYPAISINLNGGIPISYTISEQLEVYIMPIYTQYLTPNVRIDFKATNVFYCKINQYNYFGELKIGIKYKL